MVSASAAGEAGCPPRGWGSPGGHASVGHILFYGTANSPDADSEMIVKRAVFIFDESFGKFLRHGVTRRETPLAVIGDSGS